MASNHNSFELDRTEHQDQHQQQQQHQRDRLSIGDADDLEERDCSGGPPTSEAFGRGPTAKTHQSEQQSSNGPHGLSNESHTFLNRFRTRASTRSLNLPPTSSYGSWNSNEGEDDRRFGLFTHRKSFTGRSASNRNSSPSTISGNCADSPDFGKPRKWYSFSHLWNKHNGVVTNLIALPRSRLSVSSTLNSVFLGGSTSPTETSAYSSANTSAGNKKASPNTFDCSSSSRSYVLRSDHHQPHVILRSPVPARYSATSNISDYVSDFSEQECDTDLSVQRHETGDTLHKLEGRNWLIDAVDGGVTRRTISDSARRSRLSCSDYYPNFPSVAEFNEIESPASRCTNLGTSNVRKSIGRSLPTLLQAMETGHVPQSGHHRGEPVTTQDVYELLGQEFVILTGAKSIDDHYVLIFPDKGNFQNLHEHDYRKLMIYLTAIPPLEESESGFVLIIDRRTDKWNSVKLALLRLSHFFPGLIHRVFILRPTSFLQKTLSEVQSKLFRDPLDFNVTVCNTTSDLFTYIREDQLTEDLGGFLQYDKSKWAKQRIDVESYEVALKELSRKLKAFTDFFIDLEQPNDTASTQLLLSQKNDQCGLLLQELCNAVNYGEELLQRIKTGAGASNADLILSSSRRHPQSMQLINVLSVERKILQTEETSKLFKLFWATQKSSLERCLKLREFEHKFKDLQVSFDLHLAQLSRFSEMGEGANVTEDLISKTIEFQAFVAPDVAAAIELEAKGQDIVAEFPEAVDSVEPKCIELNRMGSNLQQTLDAKLKSQKECLEVQRLVERATKLCSDGKTLLSMKEFPDEAGDCVDSGVNLKKIDAFLEIIQSISNDVSRTKSMLSSETTSECRNLLKQVQKGVEDFQSLLLKQRASTSQQIARLRLRRSSTSESNREESLQGIVVAIPPTRSSKIADTSYEPRSTAQTSLREEKRLKRGHVLNELLTTETIYVQEMGEILHGYRNDVDNPAFSRTLPAQLSAKLGRTNPNVNVLFGNLEDIYKFHCSIFHPDLSNCITSVQLVGLCFTQRHSDFLALYSRYCQMLPSSENLRREIGENHPWFLACRQRLGHKLPLGAYLLKPVQRITKYQLLLKDLVKCSEDCDGQSELRDALEKILIVLRCVNDGMLQLSIVGYPGQLVDEGPLLLQGTFMMWTETRKDKLRLKGHQRYLFLYQKCVLICKKDKDPKSPSLFMRNRIPLSEIGLTEALRGNPSSRKFEIWVQGRSKVFIFQAENHQIKDLWVTSVKKLLMEQLEILRFNRTGSVEGNNAQKPEVDQKRSLMSRAKGNSVNGYRPVAPSAPHKPLRQVSSWVENRQKEPSDVEAEDSSGMSNSEDEDTGTYDSSTSTSKTSSSQRSSTSTLPGFSDNLGVYVALADYNAPKPGEISFREGEMFILRKTGVGGWWYISNLNGNESAEGWAPETFLAPVSNDSNARKNSSGSLGKPSQESHQGFAEASSNAPLKTRANLTHRILPPDVSASLR